MRRAVRKSTSTAIEQVIDQLAVFVNEEYYDLGLLYLDVLELRRLVYLDRSIIIQQQKQLDRRAGRHTVKNEKLTEVEHGSH